MCGILQKSLFQKLDLFLEFKSRVLVAFNSLKFMTKVFFIVKTPTYSENIFIDFVIYILS